MDEYEYSGIYSNILIYFAIVVVLRPGGLWFWCQSMAIVLLCPTCCFKFTNKCRYWYNYILAKPYKIFKNTWEYFCRRWSRLIRLLRSVENSECGRERERGISFFRCDWVRLRLCGCGWLSIRMGRWGCGIGIEDTVNSFIPRSCGWHGK